MKRILIACALALVLALAAFLFRDHPKIAPLMAPVQSGDSNATPASQASASPTPPPAVPPPPGVSPEFVRFLTEESARLDSTNVNTDEAELRNIEQATRMGPIEIQFARDTVNSGKGSANQRVLALYLLTLAGPKASSALREIVLAPLPDARVQAHSEEEHSLMQEKAQRVTAIDALAEQAKQDRGAKDSLLRLADEVRDPGLRNYILKKIQSLP